MVSGSQTKRWQKWKPIIRKLSEKGCHIWVRKEKKV